MKDITICGHTCTDSVVNLTELEAAQAIEAILEASPELCKCATCLADMFALTLNSVPPQYVQNLPHALESDESANAELVAAAAANSVARVSQRPTHD
jgi:competence protein ComFB